ncbi:MAG: hypothetical protein H0W89_00845 [Candidatus Levybacteria bacterium]|nr:hypothetical protein [Candidatus Levybacteria bacterium]
MKENRINYLPIEYTAPHAPRKPRHLDVGHVVEVVEAIDSVCEDAQTLRKTVKDLRGDVRDLGDVGDLGKMHLQELGHLIARYSYAMGSLEASVPRPVANEALAKYSISSSTRKDTDPERQAERLTLFRELLTSAAKPLVWAAPDTEISHTDVNSVGDKVFDMDYFFQRLDDPRIVRQYMPPVTMPQVGTIVKYKTDEQTGKYWVNLSDPRVVRNQASTGASDFVVAKYTVTDHSIDVASGIHTVATSDGTEELKKSIERKFQFHSASDAYRLTGENGQKVLELFIPSGAASILEMDALGNVDFQTRVQHRPTGSVAVAAAGDMGPNIIERFRPHVDAEGKSLHINPHLLYVAKRS